MALFRRLFYRKPPDRLLEISERVYVFDCCFSSETLGDKEYKDYLGVIVSQLQVYFPGASFMVCNFREGDKKSHISDILSEYDMTVMDYPRQYEGCPLLPLEMIHHFLRSSESWLSLEGQHNVLLMHCEKGGWPVLAFMLAGLLLYRKQYNGEQKTLELVYKQAPKELLHLFCSLNPQPSHLRYLQYITRQGSGSDWPPKDKPFILECIILRFVPQFDVKGGCRPVVRVYGQDPLTPTKRSSKILFSTPKTKKNVQHYTQENAYLKISTRCRVQGDVVLECIHVDEDLEREVIMFRVMFSTAFIESDILLLDNKEIDVVWNMKDQFPRDFKAEVLFSDFDAGESEMTLEAATGDDDVDFEGASTEEFFEAEEIFSNSEMHADTKMLDTKCAVDDSISYSEIHAVAGKDIKKLGSYITQQSSSNSINGSLDEIDRNDALVELTKMSDGAENTFAAADSEPNATEKLIMLDDLFSVDEKRMRESSSLLQKTEALSSTVEESSESKSCLDSEPKTFYTPDCQQDVENKVEVCSVSWLETSSATERGETGPNIANCDKKTINENFIALEEIDGVEGDKLAEISNFIHEGRVLFPLLMEQRSTADPSHLECVVEGALLPNHSEDIKDEKPGTKSDLDMISIFKESILSDDNRKFGSSDAAIQIMCIAETIHSERENNDSVSEVRVEAKFSNKKTRSITQRKNNEKVLPPMPKKNPTNIRPPSNPVIAKQKCNGQEGSNLHAKEAKTKIVSRWISPQKASDATSSYIPSHPPSRYNSAPPALAISLVQNDDERINTVDLAVDCISLYGNATSVGSALSLSPSSIAPSKHVLDHLSTACQHPVAHSPALQSSRLSQQPTGAPLVQPYSCDTVLKNSSTQKSFSSQSLPPPPPSPLPPLSLSPPFSPGSILHASPLSSYPPPPPPHLPNPPTSQTFANPSSPTPPLLPLGSSIKSPLSSTDSHLASGAYAQGIPPYATTPPMLPATKKALPPPPPPPRPPLLPSTFSGTSIKVTSPYPPSPPNLSGTSNKVSCPSSLSLPAPPPPPPPPTNNKVFMNASILPAPPPPPPPSINQTVLTEPPVPSSPPPPPPPPPPSMSSLGAFFSPPAITMRNSQGESPPPPPPPPPLPSYGGSSNGIPPPPPRSFKPASGGSGPTIPIPPLPPPKPNVNKSALSPLPLKVSTDGFLGAPSPPLPPTPLTRGRIPSPSSLPGAREGAQSTPFPPPPPPPPGGRNITLSPSAPLVARVASMPRHPPSGGHSSVPSPSPLGGHVAPPTPPRAPGVPPPPPIGNPNPPNGSRGTSTSLVGGRGRGLLRPMGFGSSSLAPRRSSLKPLHWVKVTRAVQGSLWAEIQKSDDAPSVSEFDELELESLFSVIPKSDGNSKSEGRRKSLGSKSDKVLLIDLRRANNTGIMLTKVKIPLPDLMGAALALDDSILDVDQVENLIKFCPTKEEMELLKAYTGDKEKLGKCEQFFLELMKVPRVESKLRVFFFKIQFHQQVSDLQKSLNTIDSACEQIRSSVKLKEIMKKILYLGNMINQGTARGSAIGFRLDSLLKLTDTRATNSKMTLMHYLCKVLSSRTPHLLDFHDGLTDLEAASKIQLKSLAEEMQAIIKGLEKVELELTASESDGPVSEVFRKTLKEFTAVAGADLRSLSSLYSAVGRNADALALYFGEDPTRCPFEQVISTLMNFVIMFRRAHQENCKQADLEKKKALKDAEAEKAKTPNPSNKMKDMSLSDQLQQSLNKSKSAKQQGNDVR